MTGAIALNHCTPEGYSQGMMRTAPGNVGFPKSGNKKKVSGFLPSTVTHPFSLCCSSYHALFLEPFIHSCPGPLELAPTPHAAMYCNTLGRSTLASHDILVPIKGM